MALNSRMNRAAVRGEVEIRSISLNQRCCSGVPPGMNWLVKNWRNDGSSLPQPSSARWHMVSASSCISGVFARTSRPRA